MAQAEGCCSCKSNRKWPKKSRIPIESVAKSIARSIANVVRLSKSKVFCGKALKQADVYDLSELSGAVEQKLLSLLNPNFNAEIQPVHAFLEQSDDAIEKDGGDEVVCLSPSLLRGSSSFSFPTGGSYGRLSPETVIIESDDEDEKMETCPSPSLICYGDASKLPADSCEDWLPFDSSPQRREWIARTVDMIDSQIENDQCYSSQSLLDGCPSSLMEDSCDVTEDLYDNWLPGDTPPDPHWISVTIDLIDNEVGDYQMPSSPSMLHESSFMDSDYL